MAAVISDLFTEPTHFHNMISNPQLQQRRSHDSSFLLDSRPSTVAQQPHPDSEFTADIHDNKTARLTAEEASETHVPSSGGGGASRLPSPPSSSTAATEHVRAASMASNTDAPSADGRKTNQSGSHLAQQPSPSSDDFRAHTVDHGSSSAQSSEGKPRQTIINVRDLEHIQSLARADLLAGSTGPGILNDPPLQQMKYEISGMPIGDVIEMVAALLTKITTTNDLQHDAMQRNVAHQQQANQTSDSSGSSQMNPLNHSVLAFHGKNVPAITIHSYLSRIHKYCPTTYEVFLSLLVYFDRMTERVNDLVAKSEEARRHAAPPEQGVPAYARRAPDKRTQGGAGTNFDESDSDLADDDDDDEDEDDDGEGDEEMSDSPAGTGSEESGRVITAPTEQATVNGPATYFVVDSFNIHRLIIAGVTCASKFFSDVFYTNSRYAKVGGLPLAELNHLELQFLVLNDFRLAVPVEDLEGYATMLVEFYAREVVAQRATTGPIGE